MIGSGIGLLIITLSVFSWKSFYREGVLQLPEEIQIIAPDSEKDNA